MRMSYACLMGLLLSGSISVCQAITIDLVAIGNPDNATDTTGYGRVNYTYQMGKYEITTLQYCAFLNAKAISDPYNLYNTDMDATYGNLGCNIKRDGSSGSYHYRMESELWMNRPVNYVSFWDAARFCNWLHNGQGDGDTETGAYTLNGYNGNDGRTIAHNPGATWFLPSEDEWYKAAYYDPSKSGDSSYWHYPTRSDTTPSNVGSDNYTDPGNHANYEGPYPHGFDSDYTIGSPYYRTNVGEFENSASAYGTFDQGGNVSEWNEAVTIVSDYDYSERGYRGGQFGMGFYDFGLRDNMRASCQPSIESMYLGFRVASIPEPGSMILILAGASSLLVYAWWRRR